MLYLGEVSTEECLRMFDPETPATIEEFGATDNGAWVGASDLPMIADVNDLITYLDGRPKLSLIDLTVKLGDEELSTHDDAEAQLDFRNEGDALAFLRKAVDDSAIEEIIDCLCANMGRYVTERNGRIHIFESFDAYLLALRAGIK